MLEFDKYLMISVFLAFNRHPDLKGSNLRH
jgi:hypothetical protein